MKIKLLLWVLLLSISTTGWGGYSFNFEDDWSSVGPSFVKIADSATGNQIAEWLLLDGEVGPHLTISMFSDGTTQAPDAFQYTFTCSDNASFDVSDLTFNSLYGGSYQFLAPNILRIVGLNFSSVPPTTSQPIFYGLQVVPEPTTLALLAWAD